MAEYTYVLGVPNFANYEASASLIRVPRGGGEIDYVSIGEDRLTRTKHTYAFPLRGIQYCLDAFGLESLEQIDFIYTDYARLAALVEQRARLPQARTRLPEAAAALSTRAHSRCRSSRRARGVGLLSVALRRGGRARRGLARLAAEHADALSLSRWRGPHARAGRSLGHRPPLLSRDRICPSVRSREGLRQDDGPGAVRRGAPRPGAGLLAARPGHVLGLQRVLQPSSAPARRREGRAAMRGPRARARSVLRARGVRRPAGMRTADGPDGRVRVRADRQPEPLYCRWHGAEWPRQCTRASALAV